MKYVKMLGLAAVAAAALMAFVGAGSASATELCSTNTSPCTGTNYGKGTKIESTLKEGEAVLTAGFGTDKCKKSTVVGEVEKTNEAGKATTGPITSLTFEECSCTTTILSNGSLSITGSGTGNGTLSSTGAESTITCSGVSCLFATSGTTIGPVTGGSPAVLAAEAKLPWKTGDASNFTCTLGSGTGTWKATYKVTNPASLFVE